MTILSIIVPLFNPNLAAINNLNKIIGNNLLPGLEFIIVDDGSSPLNANKIDVLGEHDNVELVRQENTGPGGARNTGIMKSSGKYLLFLDDDDNISDGFIYRIYSSCNNEQDLIITNFKVSNSEGVMVQDFNLLKLDASIPLQDSIIISNEKSSFGNGFIWNKVYKKEIIVKNNIYFKDIFFKEDLLFNVEYLKFVKSTSYIDDEFYIYNLHDSGNSYSRYNENRSLDIVEVKNFLLKNCSDKVRDIIEINFVKDSFHTLNNAFCHNPKIRCDYDNIISTYPMKCYVPAMYGGFSLFLFNYIMKSKSCFLVEKFYYFRFSFFKIRNFL